MTVTARLESEGHTSTTGVQLSQETDYRFAIHFEPGVPVLYGDEPAPLGRGTGPSPVQLLAAAVGNCLSASLLFALRKFKQAGEPISAEAEVGVGRSLRNRLRVQWMRVRLRLGAPARSLDKLDRILAQFEDFCTVTQSVRDAFPIDVEVHDSEGARLK